jgi:hypothetical protein
MGREARLNNANRTVTVILADGQPITLEASHGGIMDSGAFAVDLTDGSARFFAPGQWLQATISAPVLDPPSPIVLLPKP